MFQDCQGWRDYTYIGTYEQPSMHEANELGNKGRHKYFCMENSKAIKFLINDS